MFLGEDVYHIDHIENKNFFLPVKFSPYWQYGKFWNDKIFLLK